MSFARHLGLRHASKGKDDFDESSWEELDLEGVRRGERTDSARWECMHVLLGKSVRSAEWRRRESVQVMSFRINKGTAEKSEIRCRLVAHEPGYREEMDELRVGGSVVVGCEDVFTQGVELFGASRHDDDRREAPLP